MKRSQHTASSPRLLDKATPPASASDALILAAREATLLLFKEQKDREYDKYKRELEAKARTNAEWEKEQATKAASSKKRKKRTDRKVEHECHTQEQRERAWAQFPVISGLLTSQKVQARISLADTLHVKSRTLDAWYTMYNKEKKVGGCGRPSPAKVEAARVTQGMIENNNSMYHQLDVTDMVKALKRVNPYVGNRTIEGYVRQIVRDVEAAGMQKRKSFTTTHVRFEAWMSVFNAISWYCVSCAVAFGVRSDSFFINADKCGLLYNVSYDNAFLHIKFVPAGTRHTDNHPAHRSAHLPQKVDLMQVVNGSGLAGPPILFKTIKEWPGDDIHMIELSQFCMAEGQTKGGIWLCCRDVKLEDKFYQYFKLVVMPFMMRIKGDYEEGTSMKVVTICSSKRY
jgi:hypothetical protein